MADVHGPWMLLPEPLLGGRVRIRLTSTIDVPGVSEWLAQSTAVIAENQGGYIDPDQSDPID